MNSFSMFVVFALVTIAMVTAEAPTGYNYQRNGGGGSFGGGSAFGGSSSFGGGGGGYQAVSGGFQTSDGQNVDPQLLEKVRQILLNEESKSGGPGASAGSGVGGYSVGTPSGSYGEPSSSYGALSSGSSGRVVGIDLDGVRQAIQVAQFAQQSIQAGAGGSGYPSAPSYGAPSRPSSNYGASI